MQWFRLICGQAVFSKLRCDNLAGILVLLLDRGLPIGFGASCLLRKRFSAHPLNPLGQCQSRAQRKVWQDPGVEYRCTGPHGWSKCLFYFSVSEAGPCDCGA